MFLFCSATFVPPLCRSLCNCMTVSCMLHLTRNRSSLSTVSIGDLHNAGDVCFATTSPSNVQGNSVILGRSPVSRCTIKGVHLLIAATAIFYELLYFRTVAPALRERGCLHRWYLSPRAVLARLQSQRLKTSKAIYNNKCLSCFSKRSRGCETRWTSRSRVSPSRRPIRSSTFFVYSRGAVSSLSLLAL